MGETPNREDIRIIKTKKALLDALVSLLQKKNFNQITVNSLCETALISRASFYTHFDDKYDLLKYWLNHLKKTIIKNVNDYDDIETNINTFIEGNRRLISNILKDANSEVLNLIFKFMTSILDLTLKRKIGNSKNPNNIILFTFCSGGLSQLLLWQVANNFPVEVKMMNKYLYKMLECITMWDAQQENEEEPVL